MTIRRLAAIAASLALAVLCLLIAAPLRAFDGEVRERALVGPEGRKTPAAVYVPREPGPVSPSARPAVILCHGVSAGRRHMDPLARELARRGILCVAFDFGDDVIAHTVAETRAAIHLAREEGARGPIALVGHSMGVPAAAGAALADRSVLCLVALGQRPFTEPGVPHAMLIAAGAMDAFHPLGPLLKTAAEAAGRPVTPFATVRDPWTGAARRLALSPTCEHAGEVYDGALLSETVGFIEAAFAERRGEPALARFEGGPLVWRPALQASLTFLARASLGVAALLAGLLVGALLSRMPLLGRSLAGADPVLSPLGRRALAVGLVALALLPAEAGRTGLLSLEAARDVAPGLLLGILGANAILLRRSLAIPPSSRAAIATAFAAYAGWIGGTLLGALPAFARHPEMLWTAPLYLWQGVALRLQFSLEALATTLVPSALTGDLVRAAGVSGASWGLTALVLLEVAFPGRALGILLALGLRIVRAFGGPVPAEVARLTDTPEAGAAAPAEVAARSRKIALVLALGLGAILLGLLWKRTQEGLLADEGAVGTVLLAGLRLLVLPALAALVGVNGLRLVERLRRGGGAGTPLDPVGPGG